VIAAGLPPVFRVELCFADGTTESYIKLSGSLLEHWRGAIADAGARLRPVRSVRITQGRLRNPPCSADVCTLEERPSRDPIAPLEGQPRHFAVVVRRAGEPPETYRRIGGSSSDHAIEAMDKAGIGGRICVRAVVDVSTGAAS
jgi:hypothetical protein